MIDERTIQNAVVRSFEIFFSFLPFFSNLVQIFYSQSLSEKTNEMYETRQADKILYNSTFLQHNSLSVRDGLLPVIIL